MKQAESSITHLMANILKPFHYQFFSQPRLSILSEALAKFLPANKTLIGLDIGCGSGELVREISLLRPQTRFAGVDILEIIKPSIYKWLDYRIYDGKHLPYPDQAHSFSMLIDVLHHTDNPELLLTEAIRVSQDFILIKDHTCESNWDKLVLMFMDWVGNKSYGVHLPYNYLSESDWQNLFKELKLTVEEKLDNIGLYRSPLSFLFERKLHFIARLKINR